MTLTSPKSTRPVKESLRFTLPQVMAATAVVAVLCAIFRFEVDGRRGLGLIPACMFLVACSWVRRAVAARKALGLDTSFPMVVLLAVKSPVVGAVIVGVADLVFMLLGLALDLPQRMRWMLFTLRGEVGLGEMFRPVADVVVRVAIALAPTMLLASWLRRAFWRLALLPDVPDRAEPASVPGEERRPSTNC